MPSLRQLLVAHAPLLAIDAASSRIQVGWLPAGRDARWATSDEEAGAGIFRAIESLGADPAAAAAFVFCEGPGSVLGIRTAAMAIRAWCALAPRPVFAYGSLAVVAQAHGRRDATVIADARRDLWHCLVLGGNLRRVPVAELMGDLLMPEDFRHWSPLPTGTKRVPYELAELFRQTDEAELFRVTDAPDAFLHEEPTYATWAPRIHRAPENP